MDDGDDAERQEDALRTLVALAAQPAHVVRLLHAGAVERVARLLRSESDVVVRLACSCAHNLAVHGRPDIFAALAAAGVAAAFPRILALASRDVLLAAAWAVTNLARDGVLARHFIAAGVHEGLVQLVLDFDDAAVLDAALDALYNLLYADAALAPVLARLGVLPVAVDALALALADGPRALAHKALRFLLVFTLTNGALGLRRLPPAHHSDALRTSLVEAGLLEPLFALLDRRERDSELQGLALRAVNNLALTDANELPILDAGCLIPTVDLLRSTDASLISGAASVLANLSQNEMIRVALRHYGWLEPIVFLFRHEIEQSAPSVKLCDSLARFVCNMTIDDWSRQALLDRHVAPLLAATQARMRSPEVQTYFARALENLRIPVSHAVARARTAHYGASPRTSHVRTHSMPSTWTPTHTHFVPEPERPTKPVHVGEWMGAANPLQAVTFTQGVSALAPVSLRPVNSVVFTAPPVLSPKLDEVPPVSTAATPPSTMPSPTPSSAPASALSALSGISQTPTARLSHRSSAPLLTRQQAELVVESSNESLLPQLPEAAPAACLHSPCDGQAQVRREHIARELLATETSYVNSLCLMFEILVEPSRRFLNGNQMRETFGGLEEILAVNEAFLDALRTRMAAWTWDTQVADLFLPLAKELPAYSAFINRYPLAMGNYDDYVAQNPRYRAVLQGQAQARLPAVGVSLLAGHFFIMPVQRIPRYILLLEDLVRATPTTHADAQVLPVVLHEIRSVANLVNDAKASAEEASKLAALAHRLRDCPEPLVRPARRIIKEGSLIRRAHTAKGKLKSAFVYLVLLNDMLLEAVQERRALTYAAHTPLAHVQTVTFAAEDDDAKRNKFVFTVQLRGASEPHVFLCDSETERNDWVRSARRFLG